MNNVTARKLVEIDGVTYRPGESVPLSLGEERIAALERQNLVKVYECLSEDVTPAVAPLAQAEEVHTTEVPCPECNDNGVFKYTSEFCSTCGGKAFIVPAVEAESISVVESSQQQESVVEQETGSSSTPNRTRTRKK